MMKRKTICLLIGGLIVSIALSFFYQKLPLEELNNTTEYAKVVNIAEYKPEKVILEAHKVVVKTSIYVDVAGGEVDHFWMEDIKWSLRNGGERETKVDKIIIRLGKSEFERNLNVSLNPGEVKAYHLYYPSFSMWLEKELGTGIRGAIKIVLNNKTIEKNFTIPLPVARTGDTISEIYGTSSMSLTPIGWRQSDIVTYHYEGSNYTFTARTDMKFVILTYRLHNNWKEVQKIPFLDAGELATDKGKVYEIWKPSQKSKPGKTEEEVLSSESYEMLLPGEIINGQVVFEVSENEKPVYASIVNVPCLLKVTV